MKRIKILLTLMAGFLLMGASTVSAQNAPDPELYIFRNEPGDVYLLQLSLIHI